MGVFVNMDKAGRLVLPKKIRETVHANKFSVELVAEDRLVFTPVKSADEMFGSMPDLDVEGFRKQHAKER